MEAFYGNIATGEEPNPGYMSMVYVDDGRRREGTVVRRLRASFGGYAWSETALTANSLG